MSFCNNIKLSSISTFSTLIFSSRKNPLSLIIALDSDGSADGNLFWDDGVSIGMHHNIHVLDNFSYYKSDRNAKYLRYNFSKYLIYTWNFSV